MRKKPIQIEVWSDVVCPFCYIGHQQLSRALSSLPEDTDYRIEWKGYLLNPHFNKKEGENLIEHLARTKGQSVEWAQEATEHVSSFAQKEGLEFNLDAAIPADSAKAHCLLQFAKKSNQDHQVYKSLFKAYFTDGLSLEDDSLLQGIASQHELNWDEFKLQIESLKSDLNKDVQEAKVLGVQGVPFIVIDRKWGISGARGSEVMRKALLQAWEDA